MFWHTSSINMNGNHFPCDRRESNVISNYPLQIRLCYIPLLIVHYNTFLSSLQSISLTSSYPHKTYKFILLVCQVWKFLSFHSHSLSISFSLYFTFILLLNLSLEFSYRFLNFFFHIIKFSNQNLSCSNSKDPSSVFVSGELSLG